MDEGFKQRAHFGLVGEPFGVPLHGEAKGVARQLDRFGNAIGGGGREGQGGGKGFDALVVQAVHLDDGLSEDAGEGGAFIHFDGVGEEISRASGEEVVFEGIGVLILNVGVQTAA